MPAGILFKSVTFLDSTWTYVMTLFGDVDSGKKSKEIIMIIYTLFACSFISLYAVLHVFITV